MAESKENKKFLLRTPFEQKRAEVVNELNTRYPGGLGVEVGVRKGDFTKILLEGWTGSTIHAVDPWMEQDASVYDEKIHDHDENFIDAMNTLGPYEERVKVHRMLSTEAAKEIGDESVDFVYVDANHSYAAVKEDLEIWYKKIKPGGMLMGDDYHLYPEEDKFNSMFGVKKAVDGDFLAGKIWTKPTVAHWIQHCYKMPQCSLDDRIMATFQIVEGAAAALNIPAGSLERVRDRAEVDL